ncbi:nuclear transport factor 2 family protein [Pseudomonas sp. zfem002]|uniref:nuclear transport factor 2 family protein n=1 Tax=Pseudomonas sp. zfem002 TaxID=3078197 RepID=UPI0029294AA6|nr:nuclear transport factor 2 family protein [Pseudomonas sp. zfem002]MDU9394775.1 nuclear transport factor 2 family protein [Pseudomonas sp. zfem002]
MSIYLERFVERFALLDAGSLGQLEKLYSADIVFRDPLHQIHGLPALRDYFAQLYANVRELRYDIHDASETRPGEGYLRWTLHVRHPRLDGGRLISLDGCSHLQWHERVHRHQDFFDAGALLYEHVPVLGSVIAWLKGRLA